MGAFSGFFGKSPGQLRQEVAVEAAEDRLLEYDEDEATDLPFHARKDAQRTKLIVTNQRLLKETVAQTGNRNMMVTVLFGAVIVLKGDLSIANIVEIIKAAL